MVVDKGGGRREEGGGGRRREGVLWRRERDENQSFNIFFLIFFLSVTYISGLT